MPDNSPTLFVSVILPIRNEAANIHLSLGSVLAQDYPDGQIEILVIDGMSTDGTREIIHKIKESAKKYSVYLIDNLKQITPAALNCGHRYARGDIIIRVDGHCEIAPDYVRQCVQYLHKDGVDAVGGAIKTIGDTFTSRVIALAMSTTFGVGNSSFRTVRDKQLFVDSVPFPAYRRETIDLLGEYDEQMLCNEDDEYNYRLLKNGGRILLAADIKSRYYNRSSLCLLGKQYFRYGFGKYAYSKNIRARFEYVS